MKADPRLIVKAHRATYVDAQTKRIAPVDVIWLEGLPVVVGLACLWRNVVLPEEVAVGLLTVAGLLSALFQCPVLRSHESSRGQGDAVRRLSTGAERGNYTPCRESETAIRQLWLRVDRLYCDLPGEHGRCLHRRVAWANELGGCNRPRRPPRPGAVHDPEKGLRPYQRESGQGEHWCRPATTLAQWTFSSSTSKPGPAARSCRRSGEPVPRSLPGSNGSGRRVAHPGSP